MNKSKSSVIEISCFEVVEKRNFPDFWNKQTVEVKTHGEMSIIDQDEYDIIIDYVETATIDMGQNFKRFELIQNIIDNLDNEATAEYTFQHGNLKRVISVRPI